MKGQDTEKKNIIFLAHSNNDVDHFLPLIYGLKKSSLFTPRIFFLRFEEEVLSNKIHQELIKDLRIEKFSALNFPEWPWISRFLSRCLRVCFLLGGRRRAKVLFREKKYIKFFCKILYVILDLFLKKFSANLFPPARIERILKRFTPHLLIIDIQIVEQQPPYSDLRSYLLAMVVQFFRKNHLPVFMIPHGAAIRYVRGEDYPFNRPDIFKPDVLALSNEMEREVTQGLVGENTRIVVLGDLRYDYEWVEKLEEYGKNIYMVQKPKGRKVILYILGNLRFLSDEVYENEIHKDIISLLEKHPDWILWVKTHPRVIKDFDVLSTLNSDMLSRIKVFGNDVDTNALIPYADILISTLSGVLFQAIMKNRIALLYLRWKERFPYPVETIFDSANCVLKAFSKEELHRYFEDALSQKLSNPADAEEFYMKFVSGGIPLGKSLIDRYTVAIHGIIGEKGNERNTKSI